MDPPGARTCWIDDETPGHGGVYEYATLADGSQPFAAEMVSEMARYHPNVARLLREEIKDKLQDGSLGRLVYGPGQECDVEHMQCTNTILEIRLTTQYGDNPLQRLCTRIYFNEPCAIDGAIRLVSVATKHPDTHTSAEQTAHARGAEDRLHDASGWFTT
ncbi:hypothetical protein [Isoptericola haloaureus]|uniref:Uncharacterized protein n=1 Tax=Isoptericola haloaureus TaxID=1542902 RepID=A0ABU7Z7U7_9MICO